MDFSASVDCTKNDLSLCGSPFRGFSPQPPFEKYVPSVRLKQTSNITWVRDSQLPQESPELFSEPFRGTSLPDNFCLPQDSPELFSEPFRGTSSPDIFRLPQESPELFSDQMDTFDSPIDDPSQSTSIPPHSNSVQEEPSETLGVRAAKFFADVETSFENPNINPDHNLGLFHFIDNSVWDLRKRFFPNESDTVDGSKNLESAHGSAASQSVETRGTPPLPIVSNDLFAQSLAEPLNNSFPDTQISVEPSEPSGCIPDNAHEIVDSTVILDDQLSFATEIVVQHETLPSPPSSGQVSQSSCNICNFVFRNTKPSTTLEHMRSHEPRVECEKCGKPVKKVSLKRHMKSCNSVTVDRLRCTVCDKFFVSQKTLSQHRKVHSSQYTSDE